MLLSNTDMNAVYKCEWTGCSKKFNRKDHLKKHMGICKIRKCGNMEFDGEQKKEETQSRNVETELSGLPYFDQ